MRRYDPEDRPVLETFYAAFEPKRAAQGLPPQGAERISRWLDAVLPAGIHLVVERDGALIGHALLVPAGSPGVAEYAVFLHQQHRGRGAGTEVNRVAVEAAREADLERLWLSVEPDNRAAIGSYAKAGFHFLPGTTLSREVEMEIEL
ncbi:hypothetical protein BH20GEM2_BH20GEM2_12660 [soil metagenome]